MPVGSTVPLVGTAAPGAAVGIYFRRRGATFFTQRRTLTADSGGTFATSYLALDDYRYFAAALGCTSPLGLTQADPVLVGPLTSPRDALVDLTLHALPGVPVVLYFHRDNSVGYSPRRFGRTSLDGLFTATYRADADYRYYALTGPDGRTSAVGWTRAG